MTTSDDGVEEVNEHSFEKVKRKLKDRSKKVRETKEKTKKIISEQAEKIAKQAEEHEKFINKVTYLCGVLGFGGFCFLLGARPQDVPYVYCVFYVIFVPLRWIYYRYKKWHYYLLDFCYYANTIFLVTLLMYPRNEKLFMVCFSFAEVKSLDAHYSRSGWMVIMLHYNLGPLAWAIIVWRCSLVFNSIDKITSVLIHLLPAMHPEGTAQRASWPYVESKSFLWTWLFVVPLIAYTLWQILYFLIVNVLRRQRLLRDPEVMTSYRELSKKAQKANNIWWRLSGILGDQNRMLMYILLQALFTVATMALTVPIFLSYKLHVVFQILTISAAVWNGGSFVLDVMPRQVIQKEKKKTEMKPLEAQLNESSPIKSPVQNSPRGGYRESPDSASAETSQMCGYPDILDGGLETK
ncbi:hypothetical protein Cgig2_030319 [Carnegiea gigantea]|uniref:Glycerophosphocholine acyltransferase 1 n=1 Tax=Carnegiea gigantea TaxID=171969 RepID=A0A9Q1JX87_9CARY|nr:hypothetical protein Cgig2_030319 [Carnegiea gigantea]